MSCNGKNGSEDKVRGFRWFTRPDQILVHQMREHSFMSVVKKTSCLVFFWYCRQFCKKSDRRKQIPFFVAAGDKGINVTWDHLLVLTPCIKEIIENSTFHRLYIQGTRIETSLSYTYMPRCTCCPDCTTYADRFF